MPSKHHFPTLSLLGCLFLLAAVPAQAQTTDSPAATFSVNASLSSQYISRGFRQTWGKPAVQAGADYVHPSGWSLGTWASTVSDRYVQDASIEWDLYGGYGGTVGELGYSVLAYYYKYPGAVYRATGVKYDYGELSLGLSYKMLYAKYNHTVTPDFFGITNARGTGYLDVGANVDLGNAWTLNLHAGDGPGGGHRQCHLELARRQGRRDQGLRRRLERQRRRDAGVGRHRCLRPLHTRHPECGRPVRHVEPCRDHAGRWPSARRSRRIMRAADDRDPPPTKEQPHATFTQQ